MSNKPNWIDAPEWAMWLAQDKNGDWCHFLEKPIQGLFHWIPREIPEAGDAFEYADEGSIGKHPSNIDWKETLEPRP